MNRQDNEYEQFDEMRRAAERKAAMSPKAFQAMSPEEIQYTMHELQVHQIELEMQNENLRAMHTQLDAARARYFDLYDLAPVGYCTVSKEGLILEVNLTAANLLGTIKSTLVDRPMSRFVFKEAQDFYYLNRKKLFETGAPQSFELRMVKKDETVLWVRWDAAVSENEKGEPVCRITIIDISERKQKEKELADNYYQVERMNKAMLGREDRIMEMKKEVNTLLKAAGKPAIYPGGC